jgi:glycosyltransferase involved in cell wall biosynthesis
LVGGVVVGAVTTSVGLTINLAAPPLEWLPVSERAVSRLLVIVPAWNEQDALPGVLDELHAMLPDADVLVVNDGSTDATASVARRGSTMVLDLPLNLGVGGAMRAGYRFASREGYDAAVQVDADGQHAPTDVMRVVGALGVDGADVVVGARFAGVGSYAVRGPRRWAMSVLSFVLSRIARTPLSDVTSGFRASNRRAIELFAAEYPAEYLGDTIESLVIACRAGLTVRQIGVEMRPRSGGTPSHSPVKAAMFLGRALLALLIALSRPMLRAPIGGVQ